MIVAKVIPKLKYEKNGSKLDRFVSAQQKGILGGCPLSDGLDELVRTNEKKIKHWSWYGFPQLKGSYTRSLAAKTYAIRDTNEALLYLLHPSLSNNLMITINIILRANCNNKGDLHKTLGNDDKKFIECIKLFYTVLKNNKMELNPKYKALCQAAIEIFRIK